MLVITLVLIVLKSFELINWSWAGVFTPFGIYFGIIFLVELLFAKKIKERREMRKLDREFKALSDRVNKR
jgi:uncharacterized membrane protein YbhN (UPF0104 family)